MRKETKREIKGVWCGRILASIGLCVGLGLAVVRVPGLVDGISAYRQAEDKVRLFDEGIVMEFDKGRLTKVTPEYVEAEVQAQGLEPKLERAMVTALKLGGRGESVPELKQIGVQVRLLKFEWRRKLVQECLILGLFTVVIGTSILFLLRLRNATSIPLTGQLICFIPEECIAELGVQYSRLIKRGISIWKVRLMMLWCVLSLLWAFYIQINIENLGLPKIGGKGSIDE